MFDWTISDLLIRPQNRDVFRPVLYVCINMLYGASGKKNTMGDIINSQLKLTQHAITRVINLEQAV